MFTGIIEELGTIRTNVEGEIAIKAKVVLWGTNLGDLKAGDLVNLERSLQLAGRVSGHLVRGVVEGVGTLDGFTPEGEAIIARVNAPPEILRYIIMKGPVAIDGISLTVMAKDDHSFSVSLVQYTQEHTNLHTRKPGDRINIETDIIARYVDAMLEDRREAGALPSKPPA